MKELKKTTEDYYKCERCQIDSLTECRMCPCLRGGCDAALVGSVTTFVVLDETLSKEQTQWNKDNYRHLPIPEPKDEIPAEFEDADMVELLGIQKALLNGPALRTSEDWQKAFPEIIIMDPDGWHRDDRFMYEWSQEKISYSEYCNRRMMSTCLRKIPKN